MARRVPQPYLGVACLERHRALPPQAGSPVTGSSAPGGWYRMKPAWQRLLRPVVTWLVAHHVSADALTGAAVPVAAAVGVCFAFSDGASGLLLLVPALAALRLILNLLDGQVARLGGTARPMGEIGNELADRIGDVLAIGGLAFVAGVGPVPTACAVVAALLASYAGIAARAAGAPRQYGGVMSKPARMIVLAGAAPLAWLTGRPEVLLAAAWLIAVGAVLTLVQRVRAAGRWFADAA